jgi:hypothetical protein
MVITNMLIILSLVTSDSVWGSRFTWTVIISGRMSLEEFGLVGGLVSFNE